jgi:hypothetical protein
LQVAALLLTAKRKLHFTGGAGFELHQRLRTLAALVAAGGLTHTLVCKIVTGQLPRQKEKRHESAQDFSIEVDEVSDQLAVVFGDCGRAGFRILPVLGAIGTVRRGSTVATDCDGSLSGFPGPGHDGIRTYGLLMNPVYVCF